MKTKIKKVLTLTLNKKEARTLDMILCQYENEGENFTDKEYTERLNPFVEDLRETLQRIVY